MSPFSYQVVGTIRELNGYALSILQCFKVFLIYVDL